MTTSGISDHDNFQGRGGVGVNYETFSIGIDQLPQATTWYWSPTGANWIMQDHKNHFNSNGQCQQYRR